MLQYCIFFIAGFPRESCDLIVKQRLTLSVTQAHPMNVIKHLSCMPLCLERSPLFLSLGQRNVVKIQIDTKIQPNCWGKKKLGMPQPQ